jgi:serine/threonine-protein kinase
MVGEIVGSYKLTKRIGRGGMGEVFVAEHRVIDRRAAIKVLLPQMSADPKVLERFFNEARATSRIRHPGIVEVIDCGQMPDGRSYIVMELLAGRNLRDFLAREGRAEVARVTSIGAQIASAVGAAHALNIVHRDLKPDNVFVCDPDVVIKILDFGIAKLLGPGGSGSTTRTGALLGTPTYMSPEQCRGAAELDHRTDIYALGCILFELAAGRPPFAREGAGELLVAHLSEAPPPLRSLVPGAPAALEALIASMLAKDPAQRPPSMTEVEAALRALPPPPLVAAGATLVAPVGGGAVAAPLAGGTQILNAEPITTFGRSAAEIEAPARARRPWLPVAVGALAAAGLVAVGAWRLAARGGRTPEPVSPVIAAAAPPLPAPAPLPPPPSPTTTIDIESKPPGTKVELDGAAVALPVVVVKSPDRTHTVRVAAPGYQPIERTLSADAPDQVLLKLEPSAASAPQRRRHTRDPERTRVRDLDSLAE